MIDVTDNVDKNKVHALYVCVPTYFSKYPLNLKYVCFLFNIH